LFIYNALKKIFAIDYRSLALFRVLIACLILLSIFSEQLIDLKAFYADQGIIPRHIQTLLFQNSYPWQISFHLANGSYFFQLILVIIQAIFAFSLLIGYKTKLSTFVSWLFVLSLLGRNMMIFNGGDFLLRLLLFWAIFNPLGAKWSVDAWIAKQNSAEITKNTLSKDSTFFSAGSAAILIQMFCLYFFAALAKSQESDWISGQAVYFSLHIDYLTTPFGTWISQYTPVTEFFTYSSLYLELIGPILLFSPICTRFLRFVCILSFLGLQLGFYLCMAPALGIFPFVASIGILLFLPSSFWEFFNVATKKYKESKFHFSQFHTLLAKLKSNFLVKEILDKLAKSSEPENVLKSVLKTKYLIITNLAVGFLVFYCLMVNLAFMYPKTFSIPPQIAPIGGILQIDQAWNMFAKPSGFYTYWNVFLAKQNNGNERDLFQKTETINWNKPENLSGYFRNGKWLNLYTGFNTSYQAYAPYLAAYLCSDWNEKHKSIEEKLNEIEIYVMTQAPPKYNSPAPSNRETSKTLILKHKCN
jgi:hypothetical protein